MSLPYIASSLSVLASLSGADMPTAFSPEIKLEANRIGIEQCGTETQQANLIEVAQRGTENVAFTYLMGKQVNELHEDVAVNKPVKDLIYAVQPQAERSEFTSLAVYQDQDQGWAHGADWTQSSLTLPPPLAVTSRRGNRPV